MPQTSADHDVTHIHQIIIVDDHQTPAPMPPSIALNTASARAAFPRARYKMWNGDALRSFIGGTFDRDVLWAFDTLTPYSYKCDLARFCLLHAVGGLYVDLGVRLVSRWSIPVSCGIAAFRDLPFVTRNWMAMQTGLIWSQPRRREFEHAIRFIVENCRERFYGGGPLYPTGPVVFGQAMAAALTTTDRAQSGDQSIGTCRAITPESGMPNVAYVSPVSQVVALRTKVIPGDLSHLGLHGTNNYNEIWRARRVYGELEQRWTLAELDSVRRDLVRAGQLVVPLGTTGHVTWGPYVTLASGAYRATFTVLAGAVAARLRIEICAKERLIESRDFAVPFEGGATSFFLDFSLARPETGLECRLSLFGDFEGVLDALSINALQRRQPTADRATTES